MEKSQFLTKSPPQSKRLFGISAFAGTIAAGLLTGAPVATSGPAEPAEGQAQYQPIQNISYEFGSKFMSGYFVEQAGICLVTLMVTEKSDPDALLPLTAARVRLNLDPGQIAGLDSEEGRSLNFTCGEEATLLRVDFGERERLVAQQTGALRTKLVEVPQRRNLADLP